MFSMLKVNKEIKKRRSLNFKGFDSDKTVSN
jgi:hypothetical protein